MKRIFLLLAAAVLATAVAAAQNTQSPKAGTPQNPAGQGAAPWASSTSSQTVIRGCLSGSAGNYTLTDQNGMQYQVAGDDATLRSMVGREVEVTAVENPMSEAATQGDDTHPGNGVQASNVRAVSPTCHKSSSTGEPAIPDNNPDNNGASPKGTPDSSEPPSPKLMSMLQQQSAPDKTANGAKMTNPPVSSETPATPQSPTGSNSQVGSSPANVTVTTPDEANRDAQAARQGELNTNPKTGETSGRGVDNRGVNNPSQTPPNTVPKAGDTAVPGTQPSTPPPDKDQQ